MAHDEMNNTYIHNTSLNKSYWKLAIYLGTA